MEVTQPLATDKKSTLLQIAPVMLCFFAMGFVDLVGTASNYVQKRPLDLLIRKPTCFPRLYFSGS